MSAVTSISTGASPGSRQLAPIGGLRTSDDGPEIRAVVRNTVQAAMEVLAGTRPIHQLTRRLDQRCLTALHHRMSLIRLESAKASSSSPSQLHKNSAVRSVRACEVSPDVYEASAVVVDALRARAVAVRIERSKQVWRVTALEIG